MSAVTHHERKQALRNARRSLDELAACEVRLVEAARNPLVRPGAPDGYPTGGDGVGGGSGTSDPTGQSVTVRVDGARAEVRRLTDNVWTEVLRAERHLREAVKDARRALETPVERSTPAARSTVSIWCVSCMRPRPGTKGEACRFEKRTGPVKRSRADLCRWCLNRWEASSTDATRRKLPDIRLAVWKADNPDRHMTEQIERDLLAKKVS